MKKTELQLNQTPPQSTCSNGIPPVKGDEENLCTDIENDRKLVCLWLKKRDPPLPPES